MTLSVYTDLSSFTRKLQFIFTVPDHSSYQKRVNKNKIYRNINNQKDFLLIKQVRTSHIKKIGTILGKNITVELKLTIRYNI